MYSFPLATVLTSVGGVVIVGRVFGLVPGQFAEMITTLIAKRARSIKNLAIILPIGQQILSRAQIGLKRRVKHPGPRLQNRRSGSSFL
jgi:hypothetical protein